jgi:hypothetical protein
MVILSWPWSLQESPKIAPEVFRLLLLLANDPKEFALEHGDGSQEDDAVVSRWHHVVRDFMAIKPTVELSILVGLSKDSLEISASLRRNAVGQTEMAVAGYHIARALGLQSIAREGGLTPGAFRRAIYLFVHSASPEEFRAVREHRLTMSEAKRDVIDRKRYRLLRSTMRMAFWKLDHDPTQFEKEIGRPPQPSGKLKVLLGDVRSGLDLARHVRVATCSIPGCKRLFCPRSPAQKFCDTCRGDLTPSQRFYRAHKNPDPRTRNGKRRTAIRNRKVHTKTVSKWPAR